MRRLIERLLPKAAAKRRFTEIYRGNLWGSRESRSGVGSTLVQTAVIRGAIPVLLGDFHVRSMLDAPSGDFNWIRHVDLGDTRYIGGDIVERLVEGNNRAHAGPNRTFVCLDVIKDRLPRVDLILCRDCLVHLTFDEARQALRNMVESGSIWLLTTTFPDRAANTNLIGRHGWRPLNLQRPPFCFPGPQRLINEGCTEENNAYSDKCLGLWKLADIGPLL